MYVFIFFSSTRKKRVMDIVPLQYVNGLNQSIFFLILSCAIYVLSTSELIYIVL